MASFNVTDRWFTTLDGVEKILVMIIAHIDLVIRHAEDLVFQRFRRSAQQTALYIHLPFGSEKVTIIFSCFGLMDHLHAVGVFVDQTFLFPLARRNNSDGTAFIHTETPLPNVKHVRSPVGHVSPAKLLVVTPLGPESRFHIRGE